MPGTSDIILVTSVRVFATMNPASIGGGRTQLPRSIRCLFNSVHMAAPSTEELSCIMLHIFAGCLEADTIAPETVSKLFLLHQRIADALQRREIGQGGGASEFNLRDLIKVQHSHYRTAA